VAATRLLLTPPRLTTKTTEVGVDRGITSKALLGKGCCCAGGVGSSRVVDLTRPVAGRTTVSATLGPATASGRFPTERRRRGPKRLALRRDEHCVKVVDIDYVADNLTYRIDHASEKALRLRRLHAKPDLT
jgi:hypothetical protein